MAILSDFTDEQKYIAICWALLEFKMMHFASDKVHRSWHKDLTISDFYYDMLEKEYEALANRLGHNARILESIGWGPDTPSAMLVEEKLGKQKGQNQPCISNFEVHEYFGSMKDSS